MQNPHILRILPLALAANVNSEQVGVVVSRRKAWFDITFPVVILKDPTRNQKGPTRCFVYVLWKSSCALRAE